MYCSMICIHSSEIRDLRSNFVPAKPFKIGHIYRQRKPKQFFVLFFISSNFEFYLMNALVYVNIDQGIYKIKSQSCSKLKTKTTTQVFFFHKYSIEAFRRNKKLTSNLFFLKSVYPYRQIVGLIILFLEGRSAFNRVNDLAE